jgi:ubiquinone/menaquinone biosynthesis C-methylase UbiE
MAQARKAYKGLAMEGRIAEWYARNTAGDFRRFEGAARDVSERVKAGGSVLEVAPGPGYLAIELARRGFVVTGLDISHSFVRIARENAAKAGQSIAFQYGDAAHMPFEDESFDYVVCMAAFKNFTDPVGAIDEIHRVLRPGGSASIYDLRKDASGADIDREIGGMKMTRLNALFTKLVFRTVLLKNAYREEKLARIVRHSRFATGEIIREGIGFELRLRRPVAVGRTRALPPAA